MASNIDDTDVVILCGGQGTRLRSVVSDRPKSLAPVDDRVFLDILMADIRHQGGKRFILCAGHLHEQMRQYAEGQTDGQIHISVETAPLGTGGAIQNALPHIQSDTFIVLNGDSFCAVDLSALIRSHHSNQAEITIALVPNDHGRTDVGGVEMDEGGKVVSFEEKNNTQTAMHINAGVYAFDKSSWPTQLFPPFSLEKDLIPGQIPNGRVFGFEVPGPIYDIGTPERYERFRDFVADRLRP